MSESSTWKVNIIVTQKLQDFVSVCLRCIIEVRWPDSITNEELGQRTACHSYSLWSVGGSGST